MTQYPTSGRVHRLALLGNHLPRHCGIATFTTDLADAIATTFPSDIQCSVVAMNDAGRRHQYSDRVRFEIEENDLASYGRATDFLNVGAMDVLCVQHEYGIFGGKAGSHVLALLADVRMPIVTTLHTILSKPTSEQRRVMDEITRLSSRLVVMSRRGGELLREVHGVAAEKIDLIPHGIPTLPDSQTSRTRLGVEGTLLLTFGLLSPDKGIEYVIDSLPALVARHPGVRYAVVGATHPHVKEWHGETYRHQLQLRAHKLGMEKHVVFHDRFVSATELAEFLAAADIYITPYLNPEQITSGTLAYAVGTGKAVISTPYHYATEVLADGRGLLVPLRDSNAVGKALEHLLDHPAERQQMSERALAYGRDMAWSEVARRYVASFERAHRESASVRRSLSAAKRLARPPVGLPKLNLNHLRALTDDTGLLQHARFSVPRYEDGYCLDDNARGLLLMTLIEDNGTGDRQIARALSSRYLAFVTHALDPETSRFRNFMTYARTWTESRGSEDCQGRALWALGAVVGRSFDPGRKSLGGELFRTALSGVSELQSSRARSFALLGIHEYLRAFQGESSVGALQQQFSDPLLQRFREVGNAQWPWCEEILAYDNARLPQALIVTGHQLGHAEMLETGLHSLGWLTKVQSTDDGLFAPIGSNGFYPRLEQRARFDQQPIEACATVSACLDAWRATADERWAHEMWRAFSWFTGENQLQASLYDPTTGGCRDGLHADRTNENQGAESTLSFLLALTDMATLDAEMRLSNEATLTSSLHENARDAN